MFNNFTNTIPHGRLEQGLDWAVEGISVSPAVSGRLCVHNSCLAYR